MPKQLMYWYFLCNSMVKHLLKVSIWLPHLEVTFKKMWTAKSLRSAQIPLLQLKEGRLGTSMIPKAQQFWIGILNYCTVRVPRNRVKFQVNIFVLLLSISVTHQYSDNMTSFRVYRAKLLILQLCLWIEGAFIKVKGQAVRSWRRTSVSEWTFCVW